MNAYTILDAVVSIAALLFAVSFHETAHGYVAMRCGDNTARDMGRITLNPIKHIDLLGSILIPFVLAVAHAPILGWAKPVPVSLRGVPNPRRAWLLVAAAGPVSNLILAVASAVLCFGLEAANIVVSDNNILIYLIKINVSLAIFNLLPIPPLDGFGVVESLLPASMLRVTFFLRRFGFLILFAVLYTGILDPIFRGPVRLITRFLLGGSG